MCWDHHNNLGNLRQKWTNPRLHHGMYEPHEARKRIFPVHGCKHPKVCLWSAKHETTYGHQFGYPGTLYEQPSHSLPQTIDLLTKPWRTGRTNGQRQEQQESGMLWLTTVTNPGKWNTRFAVAYYSNQSKTQLGKEQAKLNVYPNHTGFSKDCCGLPQCQESKERCECKVPCSAPNQLLRLTSVTDKRQ